MKTKLRELNKRRGGYEGRAIAARVDRRSPKSERKEGRREGRGTTGCSVKHAKAGMVLDLLGVVFRRRLRGVAMIMSMRQREVRGDEEGETNVENCIVVACADTDERSLTPLFRSVPSVAPTRTLHKFLHSFRDSLNGAPPEVASPQISSAKSLYFKFHVWNWQRTRILSSISLSLSSA